MATRGSKVERRSVNSDQNYEIEYEAQKLNTSPEKVREAKKATGSNQRKDIEKAIKPKH
ncbi:MAG: DUF3606 domain-containing protein [Bacteroidetes bacterium]|nr:DUF3606 domain-containing protein [Bacteroidota bacterium]